MGLSTAERNKRKRERKKKEKEARRKQEEEEEKLRQQGGGRDDDDVAPASGGAGIDDIEIEYVPEPLAVVADKESDAFEVLKRFQERAAAAVVSDAEDATAAATAGEPGAFVGGEDENHEQEEGGRGGEDAHASSKRKLREMLRPSVAELKRRVQRPDLVEAHDVTAADPEFLIALKGVPGTVPVPRHWGRKRKYLQGKRGYEKPPFELPDFILKTGIAEVRDSAAKDEAEMSAKQKNRARVAPKMGAIDVDYKTLHDAFFKHQTKPSGMTKLGDVYYEGKELEVKTNIKPGGPLSKQLREALGMTSDTSPPPWLVNMQRYGPPPSYPSLKIPGLSAPLPSSECQYGYHPGGWGKPPVDPYGRPLYGGNPFDPPGSGADIGANDGQRLVTSDGKTIGKTSWGALPTGDIDEEESDEEEESESGSEMEESEEEGEEEATTAEGIESVLPPPSIASSVPVNLRKQAGDETPLPDQPKQLYQVIEQKQAASDKQAGAVFASDVAYVVPAAAAAAVPEGAESVLSKALPPKQSGKGKRKDNDDEDDDLGKIFKF